MSQRTPPPPKMSFNFAPIKLKPPTPPRDPRLAPILALVSQGRMNDAEVQVRALLDADPQHAMAWKTLAAVLLAQGKDALEAAQKAVARMPQDVQAVTNLGRAFHDRRMYSEAFTAYRYALRLQPNLLQALLNLGAALLETGDLTAAEAQLLQATRLHPSSPEAFNDLGLAQTAAGKLDAAYQSLQQALTLAPQHVMAMTNLGQALTKGKRHDLAASVFDRALALQPDLAKAHLGRANALRELGLLEEAEVSYRQALALQPQDPPAEVGLGICLVEQGRAEEALTHYQAAQAIERNDLAVLPSMMFARQYLSHPTPLEDIHEARTFGAAASAHAQAFQHWQVTADPHRQLRIGLVSGDLRQHPVGRFLESVLIELAAQHSASLAFVAYSNHHEEDELTARLKPRCTQWHAVADWTDAKLAHQIHQDAVDILIDLAGHTTHNRVPVFAWRPAPVQLSWLGYFATTGVAEIDYLLADPHTVPPEHETHFTETIWRLPDTRMCFTPPSEPVAVSPLPAQASGHITFGCFNHVGKINDTVIATWSRILHRVPGSRLFLKAKQLAGEAARDRLTRAFAAHGISGSQLLLEGGSPRQQYLETYHRIDIGLDPFPYTGGTTTVESLWMGVPVITQAGPNLISRQGLGLLHNAGLPHWVASDADDYVERAIAFANDLPALATLRSQLREQVLASPLFDAQAFANHFEQAMRDMWALWCERA